MQSGEKRVDVALSLLDTRGAESWEGTEVAGGQAWRRFSLSHLVPFDFGTEISHSSGKPPLILVPRGVTLRNNLEARDGPALLCIWLPASYPPPAHRLFVFGSDWAPPRTGPGRGTSFKGTHTSAQHPGGRWPAGLRTGLVSWPGLAEL